MSQIIRKFIRRFQLYKFKLNYLLSNEVIIKEIDKIIKIKDKSYKIRKLNYLFRKNKDHPLVLYHLSRAKVENSDYNGFKHIRNFEKFRVKWLLRQNKKTNEIYIPLQQVIGSLGNFYSLYYFILNNKLVLKNKLKLILLIKETEIFSNNELFKFFKPFMKIIKNNEKFYKNNFLYRINKAPIEVGLPFKNKYYPNGVAINFINQFLKKRKIEKKIFFKLNIDEKHRCRKLVSKYGIKRGDWFVLLHVRENNYQPEKLRNSDPYTYLKAINYIISQGGKVIRMGDNKMTKLPKIKGLIDYPFTNLKSDKMDVFLASECKFCLGTSSGYYALPIFFGKPVLLVNYLSTYEYFALRETDMFLPKKLISKKNGKILKIKEIFGSKVGNYILSEKYNESQIIVKDNSSEEILFSTKEMVELISNKNNKKFKLLNSHFKKHMTNCFKNKYDYKIKPFAKLPSFFLENFYK